MTVVAQKNMKIPQFSELTGEGRIIDEGGLIPQKRVVDLMELKWGGAVVQSEVTETSKRKDEKGKNAEYVYFEVFNREKRTDIHTERRHNRICAT